jgi:hypothetical protein
MAHPTLRGDTPWVTIDSHKHHGKLVRTGPEEISVSDLSAVKEGLCYVTSKVGVTSPFVDARPGQVPCSAKVTGTVYGRDLENFTSFEKEMRCFTKHSGDSPAKYIQRTH